MTQERSVIVNERKTLWRMSSRTVQSECEFRDKQTQTQDTQWEQQDLD